MPVKFRCSDCTQKLSIDDKFVGKLVACVRCGAKQRVPLETAPEFAQQPPVTPSPETPERKAPFAFKPWQPRPVHSTPLPSEPAPEFGSVPEPELLDPDFDSLDPGSVDPDSHDPLLAAAVAVPEPWDPSAVPQFTEPQGGPIAVAPPEHEAEHAYAAPHAELSLVPPAKKLDVEELIDMTAMVDIVFFLLIFFLVTSMHTLDSTIPMPAPDPQKGAAKEPTTIAAIDADDSYIVVRIDKNDKITVEGAEVRSERDLLFKLRDLRLGASRPEKLMVIGHGEATHGTAVMILDAGRELGMEHVKLSVQDEEE